MGRAPNARINRGGISALEALGGGRAGGARLAGAPRRLGLLLLFRALQDVVADLLELVQRAELELAAVVERDHHVPPEPNPPPDGHALLHALVAHVRLLLLRGEVLVIEM